MRLLIFTTELDIGNSGKAIKIEVGQIVNL